MRTLKLALMTVIILVLILVMTANMSPVALRLMPDVMGEDLLTIPQVPLAVVIIGAVMVGFLLGVLLEYVRESKHRKRLDQARREVGALREENDELAAKLGEAAEDLVPVRG